MEHGTLEQAIQQAISEEAKNLTEAALDFIRDLLTGSDPGQAEETLRGCVLSFGSQLIKRALETSDAELRAALRGRGHPSPDGGCCHGSLQSKGTKDTSILTLLGEMTVKRWTAVCKECGAWLGSVDELLVTENRMTSACASVVTSAGVTLPFEQAQAQLRRLAGLEVDDNRIQRTIAAVGPRAREWTARKPGKRLREIGNPPSGTWIYFLVDGGRIRMREGGQWREPCTGLIVWERADGSLEKIGVSDPVDKEKVTVVLDEWIRLFLSRGRVNVAIIADGAEWIWNWAAKYPWVVKVLDYYHMKEKVYETAHALYGEGTPEAVSWAKTIIGRLWRGWVPTTVKLLDRMRPRGWAGWRKRKALDALATYIENHEGLISYARRRNADCQIGSGNIESFCKQLFTMRMKGPGMFWSEDGARHLMNLRTVYLTGHWDLFWKSNGNARSKAA